MTRTARVFGAVAAFAAAAAIAAALTAAAKAPVASDQVAAKPAGWTIVSAAPSDSTVSRIAGEAITRDTSATAYYAYADSTGDDSLSAAVLPVSVSTAKSNLDETLVGSDKDFTAEGSLGAGAFASTSDVSGEVSADLFVPTEDGQTIVVIVPGAEGATAAHQVTEAAQALKVFATR